MKGYYEQSLYHKFLRVSLCVFAATLLFDAGLLSSTTTNLSRTAQQYVANAVGVKVGVAPNEVNQLTARIQELEHELEAKERTIAVSLASNNSGESNRSTFILSGILFILLTLIVLNYALDYVRSRRDSAPPYDQKIA